MDAVSQHIVQLVYRSQAGIISDTERAELNQWLADHPKQAERFAALEHDANFAQLFINRSPEALTELETQLYADIRRQLSWSEVKPVHRVHFLKTAWVRYAAAAILLFGVSTYLWNHYSQQQKAGVTSKSLPVETDVAPGGQRAVLALADGRKIVLDSAANGELAQEQGAVIRKEGDKIVYDARRVDAGAVAYNTMSTPRGGQYQLTLPDGSRVWLNAASSITYPTAFTGKERRVTITGEAYFEVTKNRDKPFRVITRTDSITVVGTSFNINSYPEENGVKTSLLEGSVKMQDNKVLHPGQAYTNGNVYATNTQQDVAWKNGVLDFNDKSLPEVLRVISRWYDVDIIQEGPIPAETIKGDIKSNLNLSDVLVVLRAFDLQARIDGKRLLVRTK